MSLAKAWVGRPLVLVLVVRGGLGVVAARPVHQDIAGAQILQHLLMDHLQRLRFQNIGLVALADPALGFAFVGQLLHRLLIQIQSGHFCAHLGKGFRHIAAQHTARAGDHHYLPTEIDT